MAMYLGKQRAVILSQKYTTEKFSFRKTLNFGGLSQSTIFRVKKVKGSTVKSKNLIPYPYYETTKTEQGVTWTVNNDGSVRIEGVPTNYTSFFFSYSVPIEYGKTYTFSMGVIPYSINLYISITAVKTDGTKVVLSMNNYIESNTFTIEDESIEKLIISVKRNNNNVQISGTIYPMLNEGTTALPYQPYFTGLKHAYIDSIKSTGKNLFNAETAIHGKALSVENGEFYNNATRFSSDYIAVLAETQYYINWAVVRWACCYDTNKNFLGQCPQKSNTLTTLAKTAYIRITANLDELNTIMLNEGETALPFEPYKEDTWQLSETLELGEWDELNPQSKEVKRRTGKIVFNNATNWVMLGSGEYARFSLSYEHLPQIPEGVEEAGAPWWTPPKIISSHFGEGDFNFDVFGLSTSNRIAKMFQQNLGSWDYFLSMNPITIEFEVEEQIEKIEGCPLSYTAFKGGTERVIQGEVDNSQFEAIPTIETGHTVIMELIIGDENG